MSIHVGPVLWSGKQDNMIEPSVWVAELTYDNQWLNRYSLSKLSSIYTLHILVTQEYLFMIGWIKP